MWWGSSPSPPQPQNPGLPIGALAGSAHRPPRKVSTGTTRNNRLNQHTHHILSPWPQTALSCLLATVTLSSPSWSLTGRFCLLRTLESPYGRAGFASTWLRLCLTRCSNKSTGGTHISCRSNLQCQQTKRQSWTRLHCSYPYPSVQH